MGGDADAAAAKLIEEFGSLGAVLAAAPSPRLNRILTTAAAGVDHLVLVRRALLQSLRNELVASPQLSSSQAAADYLFALMAFERAEQVRVLFLDAKRRLIRDEIVSRGTVAQSSIYPREIMKRALELGAVGIIIAHNHPSGDPAPSDDDVATSRELVMAGRSLGITVDDHLVVARSGCISLRAQGLLETDSDQ